MIHCVDNPPEYVEINGKQYPVEWDFLNWALHFEDFIKAFNPDTTEDANRENLQVIEDMEIMYFGSVIDENPVGVVEALAEFYCGYPKNVNSSSGHCSESDNVKLFSFKHDMNDIIIAIRNQSGIDLTHRRKELFHWWDFRLEFETLTDEHIISKKIGYRSYKGDDKELIKLRDYHALPIELTKGDKMLVDKVDSLFYDT